MAGHWICTGPLVTITSPWLSIYGERWQDDQGRSLDYWRVEKADSVIVIPLYRDTILVPPMQFRPGVQRMTLDLPGGRISGDASVVDAAAQVLQRELGIAPGDIAAVMLLNEHGWIINSSFNNQRLFGVVATIAPSANVPDQWVHAMVPTDRASTLALVEQLECLQCRSVLQTWLLGSL